MSDRVRAAVPWFLIAASVLFAALMLYVLFVGFLPAKHRVERLEAELKALYAQEAQLHGKLAQMDQQLAEQAQQVQALRAERDELARRVQELARRLGGAATPAPRRRPRARVNGGPGGVRTAGGGCRARRAGAG